MRRFAATSGKGARFFGRTPSLTHLAYLPSGQSGQEPQQSVMACITAGAAANAAVLADSSTKAAISFLMISIL